MVKQNDVLSKEVGDSPPEKPEPIFEQKPRQRFLQRFKNPIAIPIQETASYFFENTKQVIEYHEGLVQQARYGRYDNPTWEYAEKEIASIEDAEAALLFSSGMNAISSCILAFCSQGDHIIYTENCYRNIRRFCYETMSKFGVESTGISSLNDNFIEDLKAALKDNTSIVFLEIPSNPHMCMVDLKQIGEVLSQHDNIITIIDHTLASPINFQPLKHGADIAVQSCTKYLSGHGDLMMGCVAGNRKLVERIRQYRNVLGGITTGSNASLLFRSLKTLKMRMAHHNHTGDTIARFLSNHPKIKKVYYLGLPSHPHYDLGQTYMNGFGGLISFEVAGSKNQVSKFIDALKIPFIATNFGTYCTLVEQYSVFTMYHLDENDKKKMGVTDQLVRMSTGFEDPDELIQDIDQALHKM